MDLAAAKLIVDTFNRRFDEFEARMDRCFSRLMGEQQDDTADLQLCAIQEGCFSALSSTGPAAHSPPSEDAASSAAREPRVSAPVSINATPCIDEHNPDHSAVCATTDASAVFPNVNPIHLDLANATMLVASKALAQQDIMAHFATEFTFPAPFAQQVAERSTVLDVRIKQERRATIFRVEGLRDSAALLDTLLCARFGSVKCVLRDTPLSGYDGSLDDDPESGVAYFDGPLDRADGCVGRALATAAALRADAVGAAGGGLLALVVAAGSAQATYSTIGPAGDCNFADFPVITLWEEAVVRWNDDNHGLSSVCYMVELELCNLSVDIIDAHREEGSAYAALIPVDAVVVFANRGEVGTHHYIVDDARVVPADGLVQARAASVLDDPAATARLHGFALQASRHTVEFVLKSIELAHFHAELLLVANSAAARQAEMHAATILAAPRDTLLRADAVGTVGGGLLARVMAAGSTQSKCSTIYPAGDGSFAYVLIGELWEAEMLRWNNDNIGLAPMYYVAALKLSNLSVYIELFLDADSERSTRGLFICYEPVWCCADLVPIPAKMRGNFCITLFMVRRVNAVVFIRLHFACCTTCAAVSWTLAGYPDGRRCQNITLLRFSFAFAHSGDPTDLSNATFASSIFRLAKLGSIGVRSFTVKTTVYGFGVCLLLARHGLHQARRGAAAGHLRHAHALG